MKIYFYTLSDPITGEICYVGQTRYPDKREKQHNDLRTVGGNFNKYIWIMALAGKGLYPIFTIICESIDSSIIKYPGGIETEIINSLWELGCPLLNKSSSKKHRTITKYQIYFEWKDRIKSARFYQTLNLNYL